MVDFVLCASLMLSKSYCGHRDLRMPVSFNLDRGILVTGASGRIGSRLVNKLKEKGYTSVTGLDLHPAHDSRADAFRVADLSNSESLTEALGRSSFDSLIHAAAITADSDDREHSDRVVTVNTVGILNLLRTVTVRESVIFRSTIEVYPLSKGRVWSPSDPCEPESFYGLSKRLGELILQFCSMLNDTRLVILRLGPVYGSNDDLPNAVSSFVSKAIGGEEIVLYGDGSSLRDYLYIDDAVDALIWALEHPIPGIFNVSANQPVQLSQVAEMILSRIGGGSIRYLRESSNPPDKLMDTYLTRHVLGYSCKVPLSQGLDRLVGHSDRKE